MNRHIPSHDPKATRRRRLRVYGPEGDQPAEFDPVQIARVMRCPKCRQTISTMRRWRMLCPECGHEWEEESVRTLADKLADARTEAWGFVFLGLAWSVLIGFAGLIAGLFVLLYVWLHNHGASVAGAIAVVVLAVVVIGMLAAMLRPSRDVEARYQWW